MRGAGKGDGDSALLHGFLSRFLESASGYPTPPCTPPLANRVPPGPQAHRSNGSWPALYALSVLELASAASRSRESWAYLGSRSMPTG